MTGKEILGIEVEDSQVHFKESIGDYIRDVIDGALCEEIFSKICDKRNLVTEEAIAQHAFYDDPIWKQEWNRKVNEIAEALKI